MYSKMCSITEVSDVTPIINAVSTDEVMPENPAPVKESTSIAAPLEEEFTYVKNKVDIAEYAIDFLENEPSYYDIIKSYTSENRVALFILVNGIVCAAAHFDEDGSVHEYLRNDTPHKEYSSIRLWLNDFFDNTVSITKILDSVHIGEDLVPIWMTLIDAKEDDELLSEDDARMSRDMDESININSGSIIAAIGLGIILASIIIPLMIAFI